MNLSSECLEASQVDSLLLGNLTPEEYESAQDHLELCETCRARVEATIGPEQWWSDVQSVLLNSRTGAFSQRNASSTDAEPNEPSTAKLLELLGPTDDPNMLGRIGSYEIIGILGQGGMGAVFKGFDRSLNRFVAIKMLLPHLAASGAARKRFAREGQAVAAVVDDHVMAIHCVDEWQGVPYLVMTYSRGITLQKRLSDNGPLEVREILRIGMQAAKGLAAAHAQGIVHRDIKPANIFLDQNVERVQLMDFGLARAVDDASLTRSGTLAGTPQYMSPEQARAETVDHRSDLFSLGSVMYAMCTGHAPFRAESSYSVLRLITDKEPRPIREINPDIPERLCVIISKLMAKHARDRFESANQVAELLEGCIAHVQSPTTSRFPAVVASLAICRPSFPIRLLTGLLVMCCASFLAIFLLLQENEARKAASNFASAVESDVSVALKIAVERDSSIPDKEWRSLEARNQAIDSQNVMGTPLTLMFLTLPKPATVSKLMTDELEVFESATVAGILDEIERNKGPFTFIHKDRINEIEYKVDKDVAVGTFSFLAPGLYKGKIGFRARKQDTDWSITEFKLAAYGVQLDRDGGTWKTKTIVVSESKRDIEKLRGEWRVTNMRRRNQRPRSQEVEVTKFEESSFVFTESHLTVTGTEKRVAEITLRDNASPKEIDLKATEGVGAGKTAYGIYRFDGDRLVLCIGEVRPVKFTDDDAGLLVLERRQIDDESLTMTTPNPVDESKVRLINHRDARSVVEAYVAAALAGDRKTVQSLTRGSPQEPDQLAKTIDSLILNLTKLDSLATKTVFVNSPDCPSKGIALTETLKWEPSADRIDVRLRFELCKSDQRWSVTEIGIEAEELADESLKKFLEANPTAISVLPQGSTERAAGGNAKFLVLDCEEIDDLRRILGLTQLEEIYINQFVYPNTDFKILKELPQLRKLTFSKWSGLSSDEIATIEQSLPGVEVVEEENQLDRKNARVVVEAYIALALSGDIAKAAALAKNGHATADPKRIAEIPDVLNVQRLKIQTVYVNDPANPKKAFATSAAVKLEEEHKQPNGQRDGFMVFTLELTDDKWFVIDIDFESEAGAEKDLKRFLEANPKSIGLPPLTLIQLPNRARPADPSEKAPTIEITLDRKNAKAVVEAYIAAINAGDVEKAAALSKKNPSDQGLIAMIPDFIDVHRLTIAKVYVDDPANPKRALATSERVEFDFERKQPNGQPNGQLNGQLDGFMVFKLEMSDTGWFVTHIDFLIDGSLDRRLIEKFLDANPKAISVPNPAAQSPQS